MQTDKEFVLTLNAGSWTVNFALFDGGAMSLSSVSVISNALRLRKAKC